MRWKIKRNCRRVIYEAWLRIYSVINRKHPTRSGGLVLQLKYLDCGKTPYI